MTKTAAAEARSYRSTAAAATRRAEREAQDAEGYYNRGAAVARQAAWLTARPDLWEPEFDYTPAGLEATARCWRRLGDSFLRSSFRATESAAFYRELAGRYAARAA